MKKFYWILALAAGLRFFQLGSQPVWCDEPYFWMAANHEGGWLACLLHSVADDVYPPLFYLLLHGLGIFTDQLFLIRLPMALAGVGAVGVLMSMLRRHVSERAALMAGLLAAVSPLLIYYSQELKMYSILSLFLLLLLDETLHCLEDPKRGWGKLTLWALLSIYTFYLAALVWVSLMGLAVWRNRSDLRKAGNIWRGYAVAGLCFLPWMPFFVKSVVVNQGSVFNFFMDRILFYSYQNFSVGFWSSRGLAWAGLAAFALPAAYGLTRPGSEGKFARFFAGASFLPLALSWAVSMAAKPMYSDRAMLVCAFAWLALVGLGLAQLPKSLSWAGLLLLLGINFYSLRQYYFDPTSRRTDYKIAWTYVLEHWQPGDSIFHQRIDSYYPFKFYALQEARKSESSPYKDEPGAALAAPSARVAGLRPNWVFQEPPAFSSSQAAGGFRAVWRRFNAWLASKGRGIYTGYNRDFVAGQRLEEEALPGVRRIWYLNSDPAAAARLWMPQINVYRQGYTNWSPFEPETMPWLNKRFHVVSKAKAGETEITLFERNGLGGKKR